MNELHICINKFRLVKRYSFLTISIFNLDNNRDNSCNCTAYLLSRCKTLKMNISLLTEILKKSFRTLEKNIDKCICS